MIRGGLLLLLLENVVVDLVHFEKRRAKVRPLMPAPMIAILPPIVAYFGGFYGVVLHTVHHII